MDFDYFEDEEDLDDISGGAAVEGGGYEVFDRLIQDLLLSASERCVSEDGISILNREILEDICSKFSSSSTTAQQQPENKDQPKQQ